MIDNQAYKYDIHEAAIDMAAEADIRAFSLTIFSFKIVCKILITLILCQIATKNK